MQDGLIIGNVAFPDGMGFARQIGMLPEQGSGAEGAMLRAFNARTRAARRSAGAPPSRSPTASGASAAACRATMNVYLIEEDGGGVTVFDAGVRTMAPAIAAAASALGGIHRVVLGHGHVDHRGAAPGLGAPVFCHADDKEDAEGDAGRHYMDFGKLRPYARPIYPQSSSSGTAARSGSAARSRRARTSPASGSSPSRATRPARSRSTGSATASR